jgi:DeoR family transcriptional regulator, fructose operon transcriptional repressor
MQSPSRSIPAVRRQLLLEVVQRDGHGLVSDLADQLGVSADTVRRDIEQLDANGLLVRTRGGALHRSLPQPIDNRLHLDQDAKARIAAAANDLVADGETVALSGGSTVAAFAGTLDVRRELTVVTNNLLVPQALPKQSARDVYLIGGQLRADGLVTTGPVELPGAGPGAPRRLAFDTAVVGVGGVSERLGFTIAYPAEAQTVSQMIQAAERVVVLCDASKFERNVFAQLGELEVAQVLVTDVAPPPALARALDHAGVEVRVAG